MVFCFGVPMPEIRAQGDPGSRWTHPQTEDLTKHSGRFRIVGHRLASLENNLLMTVDASGARPSQIDASSSPGYLTRLASGRLILAWDPPIWIGFKEEDFLDSNEDRRLQYYSPSLPLPLLLLCLPNCVKPRPAEHLEANYSLQTYR